MSEIIVQSLSTNQFRHDNVNVNLYQFFIIITRYSCERPSIHMDKHKESIKIWQFDVSSFMPLSMKLFAWNRIQNSEFC